MKSFVSGFFAEAVSCVVWVPTDVMKERAQAKVGTGQERSIALIRGIVKEDGMRGLYRGYGATLASFGPFSAFYFMFVEQLKSTGRALAGTNELSFPQIVTACALAGGSAALITAPLDLVKVRMQVERRSGKSSEYRSVISSLRRVWHLEGWRGLFRGGGSRVWFAVPNTAITMSIMESIKYRLG